MLKINSDAAFKSKERTGDWGFVISDEQGAVVKAGAADSSKKKLAQLLNIFLTDAFHAELLGFQAGLKEAARMGITQVCIYRNECNHGEGDEYRLSKMGGVITEIKHLIASESVYCSISVCHRLCNKVAHAVRCWPSVVIIQVNPVSLGMMYLTELRIWCSAI